jgi:four helix bundle protein
VSTLDRAKALQDRTQAFAVAVIQFYNEMPRSDSARVIGRQMLRSGTSTAANYRAACRARSRADFISKISVVIEEADETLFWLELLVGAQIVEPPSVRALHDECEELVKIFSASLATAKSNR